MLWIILGVTTALLIAPTRQLVFRYWYLIIPGAVGLVIGFRFAANAVNYGAPPILLLLAPVMAAGILAGGVSNCFGPRSRSPRDGDRDR